MRENLVEIAAENVMEFYSSGHNKLYDTPYWNISWLWSMLFSVC